MKRVDKGNGGFALVLTLLLTVLIVAVVVDFINEVYVDTTVSRNFRDSQQASLLAESGALGGFRLIQQNLQAKEYTSAADLWANPIHQEDDNGALNLSITDESGRINLNGLVMPNGEMEPFTHAALVRLGRRLNIPERAWSSLADWLDSDSITRSGGAESDYYLSLRPPYSAHNGQVTTLQELSLVSGFNMDMARKLQPFVTLFSGVPGAPISLVNINSAPKEVLMALDEAIDERMAEQIIEERRLQPFKFPGELSRIPGGETLSQRLAGKVSVKGSLFRVTAVAQVKEANRIVEAVARFSGGAPETTLWQEY